MRQVVERIYVDPDLEQYISQLVHATREDKRIAVGASPRGSLALLKLARAQAILEGRDYILPDDIKSYVLPALGHRLIMEPEFWMNWCRITDYFEGKGARPTPEEAAAAVRAMLDAAHVSRCRRNDEVILILTSS